VQSFYGLRLTKRVPPWVERRTEARLRGGDIGRICTAGGLEQAVQSACAEAYPGVHRGSQTPMPDFLLRISFVGPKRNTPAGGISPSRPQAEKDGRIGGAPRVAAPTCAGRRAFTPSVGFADSSLKGEPFFYDYIFFCDCEAACWLRRTSKFPFRFP
jgi:hypothetical protein